MGTGPMMTHQYLAAVEDHPLDQQAAEFVSRPPGLDQQAERFRGDVGQKLLGEGIAVDGRVGDGRAGTEVIGDPSPRTAGGPVGSKEQSSERNQVVQVVGEISAGTALVRTDDGSDLHEQRHLMVMEAHQIQEHLLGLILLQNLIVGREVGLDRPGGHGASPQCHRHQADKNEGQICFEGFHWKLLKMKKPLRLHCR